MKKAIKVFALALSVIMAISLVACGATQTAAKKDPNRKIVVGFSQLGAESDWRTANTKSVKDACVAAGFDLQFSDAQQKQENQIKALRSFIQQKVDYIVLAPVVQTGWDTVLKEIYDSKIPLILVDRDVITTDKSDKYWITRIGENFYQEGTDLATWVKDNMFKDKDKVNVYQLEGTVGSGAAVDRGKAWADVMKDSKFVTAKSQTGDFTDAKGQEVMESWLKSDAGKIDLVYAHNDMMALGAITAIEAAGLKPGVDIKIVSVDGLKLGFEAMAAGKINCIAECSPLTGPKLVETIKKIEAGETVDKLSYAKEGVFPQDVAAKELPNRTY